MSRYGGNSGEAADLKEPLVFGKEAYYLWIALCSMAGMGLIGLVVVWIISFGG